MRIFLGISAGDEIAEPARQRLDMKKPQNEVGDDSADNAQNDVHEHAHVAAHEFFGQPAGKAADDDCRNPAYALIFHSDFPPRKTTK